MRIPWENLYDRAKDRRYGNLFLFSMVAFFGFLILAAWIAKNGSEESLLIALCAAVVCLVVWMCALVRRVLVRRPERENFSRLSSDELAKARSKLKNNMKPFSRMAPRAPDTDLKY